MVDGDTNGTSPAISNTTQEKAIASLAALSYRSGELDDYLDKICHAVIDVLGDGAAAVTLYRDGKKKVIARVPYSPKVGVPIDVHGQLSTFVVESGEILRVADAIATPEYGNPPAGYCSYLGIPLKLPNGDIVGTLCFFDKSVREYTNNDEQVATLFAERIAIALDNYELFLQLKEHSENLEALVEERTKALVAAQDALMQKEKLAAVGEFATNLTHEIRNPLATIRLALEYFERTGDDRATKRAALAGSEISRLERMLNEVLTYARPATIFPEEIDLSDFLGGFLSTNHSMVETKEQCFSVSENANPTVIADRDKLTQICLNLARNACDAAEHRQTIHWTLSKSDNTGIIQIQNGGQLIPEEKLNHITEAFVSGKPNGTGLGLAIVKNLIDAQMGELEIESNINTGTIITVSLPLKQA